MLSTEIIWQNFLTVGILFALAVFLYKNMREGKFKSFIREGIEKLKVEREK